MRYSIDPGKRPPVSLQLREQIVRGIERGRLGARDRLPAIRELADKLGIAPNTVAKVYRTLEADGYLEAHGRHGTFVAAGPRAVPDADRRLAEAADRFARRGRQLGFEDDAIVGAVRAALSGRERP